MNHLQFPPQSPFGNVQSGQRFPPFSRSYHRLHCQGREVVIVSDFSQHAAENLTELGVELSDIKIVRTDLSVYSQALKALKGAEIVFHLAATVGNLEFLHGMGGAELGALQDNHVIDTSVFKSCIKKSPFFNYISQLPS